MSIATLFLDCLELQKTLLWKGQRLFMRSSFYETVLCFCELMIRFKKNPLHLKQVELLMNCFPNTPSSTCHKCVLMLKKLVKTM